jgi:hypothetical protein
VDDIDIERGVLQVRQSAWRGKLGDPKTDDSARVIELSPQACALKDVLKVVAFEPTSFALRHSQRNAVGSELAAETEVQTFASSAWHSGAAWQWLPRFPARECNSDEQFRSFAEIASTETRSRRRLAHHGELYTHVMSEDGKRIAAQLGNAVWGVLDPSWTLEEKMGVSLVANSRYIN